MSNKKEAEELSAKLHYGIALAYQRMLENKAKLKQNVILGTPDGKVISVKASKLLKLQNTK